MKRKRGTPADKAAARQMKAAGKSVDEIARELGRHRTTITQWTNARAKRISEAEIADMRRMVRQRKSIREIQKKHKYSTYTISKYTRDIHREPLVKICHNPECKKTYETFDPNSMYCSRKCNQRHRYLRTHKKGSR